MGRRRNVTEAMIENMANEVHDGTDGCSWCGGRGWKLVTLRRAAASGADLDERGLLRRRVPCDSCAGAVVPARVGVA